MDHIAGERPAEPSGWVVSLADRTIIASKRRPNRLSFAVLLLFSRTYGRFPRHGSEIGVEVMVKYTTALRLGTAETEAILRRFTRNNVQHPTYKALSELGRAVKTVFLARYLHSLALRREIQEGLNVIEHWNGATDFVHFARRGEMVSNRREDHETSMLALRLVQNFMVYVNTLMLQEVLAQPHWQGRLTATDLRALTPLIWEHVNPYGRFDLDMTTRLPLN